MKPIRSMLFVPGSKPKWFEKIPNHNVDTVILDFEDSVPINQKDMAREQVSEVIGPLNEKGQRVYVRINKGPYCFNIKDIEAVIQPSLEGIVVPKVDGPEDIDTLTSIVSEIEYKKGIEVGTTKFIATMETARSIQFAYDIAVKNRVVGLAGVSPKSGDVERSLGYQWTAEGLERLYIRSQVVTAAKAANVIPIGGLWQDIHDLEGFREAVSFNRQLGFEGEMIVHPSFAVIVNDVFSLSVEQISYYRGLINMFEEGLEKGSAAVLYNGEHIDYAHYNTAKQMLEFEKNYHK